MSAVLSSATAKTTTSSSCKSKSSEHAPIDCANSVSLPAHLDKYKVKLQHHDDDYDDLFV